MPSLVQRSSRAALRALLVLAFACGSLVACGKSHEPRKAVLPETSPGAASVSGRAAQEATVSEKLHDATLVQSSASSFDPCPASGPCRIMPFGDSITFGVGSTGGGYRLPLFEALSGGRRTFTFVGRGANGPSTWNGVTFPREHEGYSGYTIEPCGGRPGIAPLAKDAVARAKPHVILLMIGTNDVGAGCDLSSAGARLGRLIDTLVDAAPEALLVVASLVPSQDPLFDERARVYTRDIPAVVEARRTSGKHTVFVDMQPSFEAEPSFRTRLFTDVLHPNDAGYAVMAKVWLKGLAGLR